MGHDAGGHCRLEHRVAIVVKVERDRGNPHRRADAGGFLTAAAGRNSALQVDQDLPERPTDPSVGTRERPFGRCQCQVKLGQPLLFDPAMINQDIAERQGLLRVVGVEPSQSPSIGLSFPGLNAVDVIFHATVVCLDLLRCQAFQRMRQRVADRQPQQTPSDTLDSGQMRHRGNAPRMPNRLPVTPAASLVRTMAGYPPGRTKPTEFSSTPPLIVPLATSLWHRWSVVSTLLRIGRGHR